MKHLRGDCPEADPNSDELCKVCHRCPDGDCVRLIGHTGFHFDMNTPTPTPPTEKKCSGCYIGGGNEPRTDEGCHTHQLNRYPHTTHTGWGEKVDAIANDWKEPDFAFERQDALTAHMVKMTERFKELAQHIAKEEYKRGRTDEHKRACTEGCEDCPALETQP